MVRSVFSSRSLVAASLLLVSRALAGCEVDPYCLACPDPSVDAGGLDGSTTGDAGPVDGSLAFVDAAACVPSGEDEFCNELDDDCDGTVDEGFDTTSNPLHCGGCGRECRFANSEVSCVDSECQLVACLPGFIDLDGDPGCEYQCPVFPALTESCNGLDDDCDGLVDEPEDLPAAPDDLCRTTSGTLCAGVTPICTTREGVTTWYCNYPAGVEFDPVVPNGIALDESLCDGLDGDCDGLADEVFADLGSACDNGLRGACRDAGTIVCDPADASTTTCDLTSAPDATPGAPTTEVCNGIDDDCNGTVDDGVVDDMVHVVSGGHDFWIYRYEASRPDASSSSAGVSGARTCSNAGVLPWTYVGHDEAAAACAATGRRLCTGDEWRLACEGAAGSTYPYGDAYDATACNGADRLVSPALATTGSVTTCASSGGIYDLSGNVKEWSDTVTSTSGGRSTYEVRGGSYESPRLGLTCDTELSRATEDTILGTLGFRCCDDSL